MNSLDKLIKAKRKRRYKYLKKLRKARDMASNYTKRTITIKTLTKRLDYSYVDVNHVGVIASDIVEDEVLLTAPTNRKPLPPIPRKRK